MTQKFSAGLATRCPGDHDRGHHTSFQCVLDAGHAGYCQPYRAPNVDEWRALKAELEALRAIEQDIRKVCMPMIDDEYDDAPIVELIDQVILNAYKHSAIADEALNELELLREQNGYLMAEIDAMSSAVGAGHDLYTEVVAGVQAGQTARKPGP